jgi:hypothetical protein
MYQSVAYFRFWGGAKLVLCLNRSERDYNDSCEILHNKTDEGRHLIPLQSLRSSGVDAGFPERKRQLPHSGGYSY